MEKTDFNLVIALNFFVLFSPFASEAAPRLDSSRPWLTGENYSDKLGSTRPRGQGMASSAPGWVSLKPPMGSPDYFPVFQTDFDESKRTLPWSSPGNNLWPMPGIQGRRLDHTRPWLNPEHKWGQGWKKPWFSQGGGPSKTAQNRRFDRTRTWLKPAKNWGQGWKKLWLNPGQGSSSTIQNRRLDPSRPWLKPENNWGQGWGSSRPEVSSTKPPPMNNPPDDV